MVISIPPQNDLRYRLREKMHELRLPLEVPYRTLIIDFLNMVFGKATKTCEKYWSKLVSSLNLYFEFQLQCVSRAGFGGSVTGSSGALSAVMQTTFTQSEMGSDGSIGEGANRKKGGESASERVHAGAQTGSTRVQVSRTSGDALGDSSAPLPRQLQSIDLMRAVFFPVPPSTPQDTPSQPFSGRWLLFKRYVCLCGCVEGGMCEGVRVHVCVYECVCLFVCVK
jgi:hypothetical protein